MSQRYQDFRALGQDSHQASQKETPLARGAGRGHVLYLDAGSGVAGDMLVAALIDLGVPQSAIEAGLEGLGVNGYRLHVRTVQRSSLRALHFEVQVEEQQPARDYAAIAAVLRAATSLSDGARELALSAFELLASAEAQIHGVPVAQVHFHEVGAVDSIVDVVAAAIAFDYLGARVQCSPLPMGRGSVRTSHGVIPLPAPATVLCLQGVPTYAAGIEGELVTPTGACITRCVTSEFGGWPSMRVERCGFGAGTRELADRPNVLRVVLGVPDETRMQPSTQTGQQASSHVVVEANLDDLTGELAAYALACALEAGALDAWTTPIGMKKGRPALMLSALCTPELRDAVITRLLSETTSLGVRYYPVARVERPRRTLEVATKFGPIVVKIAGGDGLPEQVAPEYESCRQAAQAQKAALREVYAAAYAAYAAYAANQAKPTGS